MNLKFLALGVLLIGFAVSANAQTTNTVSAAANATVKKALTIAKTTDLSFGTFAGLNTATSEVIVLPATGLRTGSTADLLGLDGIAAVFTITGEAGAIVTLTLPSGVTSLAGPGDAMTIASGAWTTNSGGDAAIALTGGTAVIKVGATLAVGINQTAGDYTGTFAVSVNYN